MTMPLLISGYRPGLFEEEEARRQASPLPKPPELPPHPIRLGGRRTHPPLKRGDVLNGRRVLRILPSDATLNERAEVKCIRCGRVSAIYAFNLRTHFCRCQHSRGARCSG